MPKLTNVLVVDDCVMDTSRLRTTLHLIFGYEINVHEANTLSIAIDQVLKHKPHLVLRDYNLELSTDRACDCIPYLRRVGYDGPIGIVSGTAIRKWRLKLMAAGAAEVLHKDNVDSIRSNETMRGILDTIGFDMAESN